jgi:hypothetical protein
MQRDYGAASWTWNTSGLAGGTYQVGVWALQAGSANSYDAYGITTFTLGGDGCVSAGLSPGVAPPQARGALVTFTASSTGCASPQYEFWLLPPGGAWTVVQPYGAGTTWQFDSSRYAAGNLQVGVWARQSSSSSSYDSFFVSTYSISPPAGCVVSALNPSAATPQPVGTALTFTPQQSGCSNQYKFWLLPPGRSWTVVQGYGVGGTWAWNSVGYAPGVYEVGVWEGAASRPSTYESYAITSFALGVLTCTSGAMSGPPPPQASGTAVAFNATSTRCGTPQYEFWLQTPGGGWSVQQGYGAAAWTWSTSGLALGTYQVGIWARQSGSTNAYDAYFIRTYQIG